MADSFLSMSGKLRLTYYRLFRRNRASRQAYQSLCDEVALSPIKDDLQWAQARLLTKRLQKFLLEQDAAAPRINQSIEAYQRNLSAYLSSYEEVRFVSKPARR